MDKETESQRKFYNLFKSIKLVNEKVIVKPKFTWFQIKVLSFPNLSIPVW